MTNLDNLLRSHKAAKHVPVRLHFHLEMTICEFNGVSGQHGKGLWEACKMWGQFLIESQQIN